MSNRRERWSSLIENEGLTLTTFHVGSPESLIVLEDWVEFFSGVHKLHTRMVTCSQITGSFQPEALTSRIPNAEVVDLPQRGLAVTELDPVGIWAGITGSRTRLVALVKLDTLPYACHPHLDWIDDTARLIDHHDAWGATGFRTHMCKAVDSRHALTQSFSHNYSIFDRDRWIFALRSEIPDVLDRVERYATVPEDRFRFEAAVESHLMASNEWNVRLVESRSWSVFHINQWEEQLFAIREAYRQRVDVDRFLDLPTPRRRPGWERPPWHRYYGRSKPSLPRRMRVLAGKWRRSLFGD